MRRFSLIILAGIVFLTAATTPRNRATAISGKLSINILRTTEEPGSVVHFQSMFPNLNRSFSPELAHRWQF